MHNSIRTGLAVFSAGLLGASLLVAGTAGAGASAPAPTSRAVCNTAPAGYATCDAYVRVASTGVPLVSRNVSPTVNPAGYHPADLQKAYALTAASAKATGTVAIVDAFNDPSAEADLGVYRKQFALPVCTTANGCFKKINQNGAASPLPPTDNGWSEEISLDLDMVSAICPHCKIILVEATSNSFTNLGAAAKRAGMLAHIVSNSYGGHDATGALAFAPDYTKAGVQYVASNGDHNFNGDGNLSGPQIPAAFQSVTAVGGTALKRASNARGFTESVWKTSSIEGTNSGCSVTVAKPAWQHDTICKKRMIGDVSAVADPNTGVSVFDSNAPVGGWAVFGGTSASSPIIASIYALAGNAASIPNNASHVYANAAHLNDVTVGNNGTCGGNYECTAKVGYDGPTGLGTPIGTAAF